MSPDAERFTAKTTVLIENVRHHIDEEEKEWVPQVRAGLGRKTLQEIGPRWSRQGRRRRRVPRSPVHSRRRSTRSSRDPAHYEC